jgi:hypothetical protein
MSAAAQAIAAVLLVWNGSAEAAPVGPKEAAGLVGETATVCGVVASAKYAADLRLQPTFLNLDKPYPDQLFTVVIFGEDRAKFGTPETSLRGQRICATGVIRIFREQPEMVLKDPNQLSK